MARDIDKRSDRRCCSSFSSIRLLTIIKKELVKLFEYPMLEYEYGSCMLKKRKKLVGIFKRILIYLLHIGTI
jgi:hypothetical protein